MRPPIDVWQGCSDYWQSAFIRENLLPLGHRAWQGYLNHGRGLVACEVEVGATTIINSHRDLARYSTHYIAAAAVPVYLESQQLAVADIDHAIAALQTYTPDREIVLAIKGNGSIELDWLRNSAIAPPDCYHQVRNRWVEFHLDPQPLRRYGDAP